MGHDGRKQNKCANSSCTESVQPSSLQRDNLADSRTSPKSEKASHSTAGTGNLTGKGIASFPLDASDLANFLTMDRHIGFNCSAQVLLRSVLVEKQELCFSVVSLLWHKLIAAPETQPSAEGTSAQQGWRQVICDISNLMKYLLLDHFTFKSLNFFKHLSRKDHICLEKLIFV
ncbi:hypothetical protein CsSME_00014486 [Camellia sinensis var. sinensis]